MSYDYRLDKYYDDADQDNLKAEYIDQLNSSERYSEMSKIASGGMKTIFKAFDKKSQRYVAFASLNENSPADIKETFIKEARLTAKLNHPNIIPIYNIGLHGNETPFFTMELKTGDSLNTIIQKVKEENVEYTAKYSLRTLLEIFIKVCDAIAFAHSKKVIHLDIKPDNIQVGSYGEVIVCDWGLSKVYDKQIDTVDINQKLISPDKLNSSTLHGYIKGSPGFMAPEQIEGEKKTPQTDIFSLGCLLYSLLHHDAPFQGKDLNNILESTVNGDFSLDNDIPKSIEAVLNKAMAIKTQERYASVNDLKKDIQNFLNGYATEAEEASSFKLLNLFILRNKALSFITLTSLLVIIIGTLAFIQNIQEEKEVAQENLRLFKAQKEETYKAQKEYYQALINKQNNNFHSNYGKFADEAHQRTIRGLKELIEAYPQYSEAKSALGYHLFVVQKFHQAEKYLKEHPGIYSYMLPHIQKYKNLKKDKDLLPPKSFVELLKDIQPIKPLHVKMLMIYSKRDDNPEAYIPAIKHILTRLNPEWNSNNFNYLPETERLNISGHNFKMLNQGYGAPSPILALRIKSLSVKGTGIEDLRTLKDTPIRSLDISDTNVPFHNFQANHSKALLRLIIKSDQYKKWQLEQLPKIMEIKFSDAPKN